MTRSPTPLSTILALVGLFLGGAAVGVALARFLRQARLGGGGQLLCVADCVSVISMR
ncbi:MAG: hypothetical protein ACRDWA_08645 [Acidimicrobiia bacterium]